MKNLNKTYLDIFEYFLFESDDPRNSKSGIRVNGKLFSKKEALKHYQSQTKDLIYTVKNADYKDGFAAQRELKILNTLIAKLKLEFKIYDLEQKQNEIRNNKEYEKMGKKIDKIRDELYKLKYKRF